MGHSSVLLITSRKQGFGPGRVSPLVPVHSWTGTNGGIYPDSWGQGVGRASLAIGPGSSGLFGPGFRHESGPMGLAPGPQPLVPVCGWNRDQRGSFSPGSSHEPRPMRCNYNYKLKSFYKPLVLLKLKLYKIYATKIIKVFSVQNIKSKKNFHKEFFVRNFNSKNNYHKDFFC